jgi:hypothetical protein
MLQERTTAGEMTRRVNDSEQRGKREGKQLKAKIKIRSGLPLEIGRGDGGV